MFDYAIAAVEGALAAGASYADARVVATRTEKIEVLNQKLQEVDRAETIGVGVRALIGSSWGFFATADLTMAAARRAGERAAQNPHLATAAGGRLLSGGGQRRRR